MKQTGFIRLLAVGAVSAFALGTAFAQTTTKETTTTTGGTGVSASTTTSSTDTGVAASTTTTTAGSSLDATGTITTYSPGTDYISVRTTSSEAPVKYYTTKSTTVVDSTGAPVDWALLRADLPVRYTYVKEGDRMVVSKITVQKPVAEIRETTTTTTTTTHK
jgi:hypothetical protein